VSSKPPVGYVNVRVFSHATEDPEKVQTAVRNTLPEELAQCAIIGKTSLTGHHGNPITLFETRFTEKGVISSIIQKLALGITSLDKIKLGDEMSLHVEGRDLYLRFDKQSAYRDELQFSSNDPIHFKIHFNNKKSEEIILLCKETGLLP
jgi:RNA binding exosome subunit